MFSSKFLALFTALVVAIVGSASAFPLANRQTPVGPLCHYTLTPSSPFPPEADLETEMNYAIGRELAVEAPSHTINGGGCTAAAQGDGTYKADCNDAAVGLTDAETAALIETWTGKVIQGFAVPSWTIDEVHCDA